MVTFIFFKQEVVQCFVCNTYSLIFWLLPICRHVDIMGSLPSCEWQTYLLTRINHLFHWFEALPMSDSMKETTAKMFILRWLSHFGVPAVIITNRSQQFESNLFNEVMKLLWSNRIRTMVYHLQASSFVEKFHWTLKSPIRTLKV